MKKVLTMTLNPCIDRTVYMESFEVGATNIVKKVIEEAAGKGINVAIGLNHLQVPVKALGFAYIEDADKLYGKLDTEQIPYSFVEVEGRLRVNQKLFDESKFEMTECNEKGMSVIGEDVNKLLKMLEEELTEASILVLSGSVPPGVNKDIYAVMTEMANEVGVKVVLDASGELLLEGVKAKPYLIKPNKEEFVKTFMPVEKLKTETSEWKSTEIGYDDEVIICKAKELLMESLTYICVSLGDKGALLISRENPDEGIMNPTVVADIRPAIPVPIRSLQGAGDAMVAGLCKAIYEKKEEKMLDYALHMAASTIMLEGTQMGDKVE